MTNHRRRIQTRTRNISANRQWWSNPEWHNADVARRKRQKALDRRRAALGRAAHRAADNLQRIREAFTDIGTAATTATHKIRDFGAAWSTLDQLAARGWDVREDMDALATEEAEATAATRAGVIE